MSRLIWTEQLDGWRAGRYRIELAAPGLWVLTTLTDHSGRNGKTEKIEATSGSLSGLKYEAEQLAVGRARKRRLIRRSLQFALAFSAVAVSSISAAGWAPFVTLGGTCVAIVSAVGLVDAVAGRPFEHLKDTYQ